MGVDISAALLDNLWAALPLVAKSKKTPLFRLEQPAATFSGRNLDLAVPGCVMIGELTCWGCAAPLSHVNTLREGAGAASKPENILSFQ